MIKNFKILPKCGRDRFCGFRALSGRGKKLFGKSIEIYKTNKNMKKYVWAWRACAVSGR